MRWWWIRTWARRYESGTDVQDLLDTFDRHRIELEAEAADLASARSEGGMVVIADSRLTHCGHRGAEPRGISRRTLFEGEARAGRPAEG